MAVKSTTIWLGLLCIWITSLASFLSLNHPLTGTIILRISMDVPTGHLTRSAPSYLRAHSIVLISSHSCLSWRHAVTYGPESGTQSTSPFHPSRGQPIMRPPPRQLPTTGRTHFFVQHTYTCLRNLPSYHYSWPWWRYFTSKVKIDNCGGLSSKKKHRSIVTTTESSALPVICDIPLDGFNSDNSEDANVRDRSPSNAAPATATPITHSTAPVNHPPQPPNPVPDPPSIAAKSSSKAITFKIPSITLDTPHANIRPWTDAEDQELCNMKYEVWHQTPPFVEDDRSQTSSWSRGLSNPLGPSQTDAWTRGPSWTGGRGLNTQA